MPTVFSRIIAGELPGEFVWRDDRCVAFLSIAPLSAGHTLVVPRDEIDHWLDCPPDLRDHLFAVAHTMGRAIDKAFSPGRIGLMIAGFEVPHLHVHVFGADGLGDFDLGRARPVDRGELAAVGERLRAAL